MSYSLILFDLDGTLLNTAPDILAACNYTLRKYGYSEVSEQVLMTKVTAGMREMMKLGIPKDEWASSDVEGKMRDTFAEYYLEHICDRTAAYEGISDFIDCLAKADIKTAVITNKYKRMADKILKKFSFSEHFSLILGCDSLTHAKPHPEPLLKAMELMNAKAYNTLYIGDHKNDIEAARAAGCKSAVALWGYGGGECGDPLSWGADIAARDIKDLRAQLRI
ncbi:MAG TPA: hypothetical protein DCR21_06340 [Succinivibrionaceae bacterium]|nr:hypothetical protein [Succinivibrionaceae bacterium]